MSDLQQRNEAFRQFLETLNPVQRAAVERLEGPVLVIAGPGTGKTHLLAARIGNILLRTDARAQNVLCLTFTEAGAFAMRRRLLERIGPEAHRAPIFTFHGFCNRVIQENQSYFGSGRLEPLSDLERIEIVRNLLIDTPVTHPLRAGRKDLFQFEKQVRDLFANMKKEGWTPGFVLRKTDEYLRALPENPNFIYQKNTKYGQKGAPKTALIQETTDKLTRLKAAADLFPKYQAALDKAGRYEYEDMLLWVNRAFEKHEALLRSYQERYQYILIDEFQDTNGAQFQLLNQLLDFWETPNIFIVGDDDQSIFEFQGARLENLLQFANHYRKGLEIMVLTDNYRSTQGVLDTAGNVIRHNTLRAVERFETPLLKSLKAVTNRTSKPSVRSYATLYHELTGMVNHIQSLLDAGTLPTEIAVLYSRHKQADGLQNLLNKKGIPFQTKRPINVLEVPMIQQMRALLQYIWDEQQQPFSGEHRLFKIFHAAFWNLNPLDLALIVAAEQNPGKNRDQDARYVTGDDFIETSWPFSWRQTFADEQKLQVLKLSNTQAFIALGVTLNQWILDASNLPIHQFLERIYTQSGLLDWILKHDDKVWLLQVLQSFTNAVPPPSMGIHKSNLGYFLQVLASMEANGLSLPLQSTIESAPGVQLLTAHAAKGLEFDHVFLFDTVDNAWENSAGDSRGRFNLPPTLTLSGEEDALEARRRLFYVALTRAKTGLYISYAESGADLKPTLQSRFVDETEIPAVYQEISEAEVLQTQVLLMKEAPKPHLELPENHVVDLLLKDFTLNITALNRYLRCPLAFWYEDLLKVPGAMSESAAFGIAIHSALQRFFLKMKADKQAQWPTFETLNKLFSREMDQLRNYFSEHGFVQRLALGKENLRRIHVEQIPFWRKRAIVERRIAQVEFDGIPLTGVLDKIEWLDEGKLRIVDYKTGNPDPKKTAAPNDQLPHGGDYWRQLAFYQILLENARIYPEKIEKTAINWLEPDKKGAFPIVEISFSRQELETVKTLIKEVYEQIQARAFHTGCGKPDCIWCKMHRDRQWSSSFERNQEAALDD
ncbi:MAG: ATP-dependent helicase [Saprospiraceae bacterium]|nr:ATP-dependent helicase [Saprospiraceae bacterium]